MRITTLILAMVAGTMAASTTARIDDPNFLLSSGATSIAPTATDDSVPDTTIPTTLAAADTSASDSILPSHSALLGSPPQSPGDATTTTPAPAAVNTPASEFTNSSPPSHSPVPTSPPQLSNATSTVSLETTRLLTFSADIHFALPDVFTAAQTSLESDNPPSTSQSPTSATSSSQSLPTSPSGPAPAPALVHSHEVKDEDDCAKEKTTLVTFVRPATSHQSKNPDHAYPTQSNPSSYGGRPAVKHPRYK